MTKRLLILFPAILLSLALVVPAKAFYLEVPAWMKTVWQQAQAQDGGEVAPAPVGEAQPVVTTAPVPVAEPVVGPTIAVPAPVVKPIVGGNTTPIANTFSNGEPTQTCRVNGVEMPGSCDKYNNDSNGSSGGQMMENKQPQDNTRYLRDMQRGAKDMGRNLTRLEKMMVDAEKKGMTLSTDLRDKLQTAKTKVESIKSATSAEELQDVSMDDVNETISDLEEWRRETFEKQQRLDNLRRNMRGMNSNVTMFEKQVAKLEKQKIVVAEDVKTNLTKLKELLTAVKNAKSWDEVEDLGVDEMQDLMQNLDESRQQLEMMTRWPQTLRQLDKELKNLARELKRSQTTVTRLSKQGIDLNDLLASFSGAIDKLKAVRDEAAAKMQSGMAMEAFDLVENDFFGQMEDVWQSNMVIQTMNNLGRFNSDFRRGVTQAQQTIAKLKRKKLDTSGLVDILNQTKAKGADVLTLMKSKPVDVEAIKAALDELEDLRQEFESSVGELTGEGEMMPWEQGQQQFKEMRVPESVQRVLPKKTVVAPEPTMNEGGGEVSESNPQPSPSPVQ